MTYISRGNYHYDVALGLRSEAMTWNKFGYNNDVDVGTETIWAPGGTHTILTSASTLDVVSSSANDTNSSGTGARQLYIVGVDGSWAEVTETVSLSGVTPVTTSNSFLGVNRAYVVSSGSSDSNEGDITITATTGGTTQAYIPTGDGVTQQLIYFTQVNRTALADWLLLNVNKISGGGSPRVTIKGWAYSYVVDCVYEVFRHTIDTAVENTVELRPSQPFVITGKQCLYFTATTDTNNTVVSGRFSLIDVDVS